MIIKTFTAHYVPYKHKIELISYFEGIPEDLVTSCFGIIEYQNKIALVQHHTRGIEIPGGHKESNETSIETLKREIQEEVGLTNLENIKGLVAQKITLFETPDLNYKYPSPVSYQVFFHAVAKTKGSIVEGLDSTGVIFYDKEELKKISLYTEYQEIFDLILGN